MSNRRMIASNLFEDAFIGQLGTLERLLWIGLIAVAADDQGRMEDNAALLRAKIFPFDRDMSVDQVERGLAKFARAKKITRYTSAGGCALIQLVKWWRHQSPSWAAPSIYPAPCEWQDRIKCHAPGNKIVMFEWEGRGGYIRGYVGRYVAEEVDGYIPAGLSELHSPINEVKEEIKDKVKLEGGGGGEVCAVNGVKAPVPVYVDAQAPTAPTLPPPVQTPPPPPPPDVPLEVASDNMTGREIVCELAGWTSIPGVQLAGVDGNLSALTTLYPQKETLRAYCREFALEYYRRYPARSSAGWLDWAVMGHIPPQRAKRGT